MLQFEWTAGLYTALRHRVLSGRSVIRAASARSTNLARLQWAQTCRSPQNAPMSTWGRKQTTRSSQCLATLSICCVSQSVPSQGWIFRILIKQTGCGTQGDARRSGSGVPDARSIPPPASSPYPTYGGGGQRTTLRPLGPASLGYLCHSDLDPNAAISGISGDPIWPADRSFSARSAAGMPW